MDLPEKKCFSCKRVLPLAEFYAHYAMKDGHINKCRACCCRDKKERMHLSVEERQDRNESIAISNARRLRTSDGYEVIVDEKDYAALSSYTWRTVGPVNKYAFRCIKIGGKSHTIFMHKWVLGAGKGQMVDHKNRNPLDNRRSNLRLCTASENAINAGKTSRSTTSKFKGVCWNKRERIWRAKIRKEGKHFSIGSFAKEEDAARAYNREAAKLFGEFAVLNEFD